VLARLRSVICPSAGHASSVALVGELAVVERAMTVSLGGVPVDLSPLEYRLVA
jgi:DNA-binding response OmpR family regulator